MPDSPTSTGAVIDLLVANDLLGEIDMSPSHARTIKARRRIPAGWILRIHEAAMRHSLPITLELLLRLSQAPAESERAAP